MDYIEPPPAVLPISWTPENVYIPSAPSTVTAIVNAAQDIMEKLHRLDFEATIARIDKLLDTANERLGAVDVRKLQQRVETTLGHARQAPSTSCRRRSSPTRPPRS